MISIKVNDKNNFMQNLLVQNTFDSLLVTEGEINAFSSFTFDGRKNTNFYAEEERAAVGEDFVSWSQIKKICHDMVCGEMAPSRIKLVLALPRSKYVQAIEHSGAALTPDNISGLYIHILYEGSEINIITGTSLNIFTMDKTLDKYWDDYIHKFLSQRFQITV